MASRIMHMAVAARLLPDLPLSMDVDRFLTGSLLPDASAQRDASHFLGRDGNLESLRRLHLAARSTPEGGKTMTERAILALRMARQHLASPVSVQAYDDLYRDLQPGMNLSWHGFGQPPVLSFRADFDDVAYNKQRQERRELIKGRFGGGNLGWIIPEDLPLFAALYRKPIALMDEVQFTIMTLIERLGPLNIQQIKEETGYLVKTITPALHRLQEAFLLYEDQYDGEWDRAWYRFEEMFPDADLHAMTREDTLDALLCRFARRFPGFDVKMAKSYYKLPEKELKSAVQRLCEQGQLTNLNGAYLLAEDAALLPQYADAPLPPVLALHRNDPIVRAEEIRLKATFKPSLDALPYDHDPLQYILVDGELRAVAAGHFRYGPYEVHDVVADAADLLERREEILAAVRRENPGSVIQRFMGRSIV